MKSSSKSSGSPAAVHSYSRAYRLFRTRQTANPMSSFWRPAARSPVLRPRARKRAIRPAL